jgi:hypothetical protein
VTTGFLCGLAGVLRDNMQIDKLQKKYVASCAITYNQRIMIEINATIRSHV